MKTLRLIICALVAIAVTGCASMTPHEMPGKYVTVKIGEPPAGQIAHASWTDNHCLITIHPDHYTHETLGHELRHCIEGYWHD